MTKQQKGDKLKDHFLNDAEYGMSAWEPCNEYGEFFALAFNAFKVTNSSYPDEKVIKQELLNANYVGYDKIANQWLRAKPIINDGDIIPSSADFYYPNLKKWIRHNISYNEYGNFYLIQGLAAPGVTYSAIIHNHTDLMYDCDIAIRQNLNATRAPLFVAVTNADEALSIKQGIQQQQAGHPVIVVAETIVENYKGIPLNTPVTFPTIYEFRQKVRNSLLNKLATLTANTYKKERVQSAEVNAGVGECEDYVYSFIDNVNRQLEAYGLPQRLENNTSLEEIYFNEEETN